MSELKDWLQTYRKKNTRTLYLSATRHLLISVYGGEIDRSDKEFENLATKYIDECKAGRDWYQDLLDYAVYLGKDNRPPASAKTYMACVRGFIEFSLNIELSKRQLGKLRGRLPKGSRARTVEGDLTKEKLRKILTHCDSKGNAYFLLLASSGIRKGEALKLLIDDIDMESDLAKVTVRGEIAKEGDTYFSFVSREAKEALLEWLKIRDDYLKSSLYRGRGLSKLGDGKGVKSVKDDRFFPFSGSVADSMWTNAIKKAGFDGRDRSTNRHKFHIHMLRKFFQTQMKNAGVPGSLVEALIGHSGYLSEAYDKFSKEQIIEWYLKGEPHLMLNMSAETQVVIASKIDKQQQKLTELKDLMIVQMAKNDKQQGEITSLKQKVTSLEKLYDKFFQMKPEAVWDLMQAVEREPQAIEREHERREWKEQLKQTKEAWTEEKKKKLAKT